MGRKKIQISRITDERNRQVTFNKRKFGVMKKAYELSVLCDCEIALIIFSSSNKLYQYASTDMDKVLLKYTEYNEPHESLTNKNIIEKENKNGVMSPESPEQDTDYTLTPRTEAKYSKIDADFEMLMQRPNLTGGPGMSSRSITNPNYTLPVSVPVPGNYPDGMLQASPQMSHTISPRPSSSETDSGGISLIIYPSGSMLEMSNGFPHSHSPLGGSPSPGPTPGIVHHLPHKQQSPSCQNGRASNLRVVIPPPSIAQNMSTADDMAFADQQQQQQQRHNQTSLNTPVVTLQTPIPALTGYSFPQDFSMSSSDVMSLPSWTHQGLVQHTSLPHLAVSNSTPPPSISPGSIKVKSEPQSPPRDGSGGHQQNSNSSVGSNNSTMGMNMVNNSNSNALSINALNVAVNGNNNNNNNGANNTDSGGGGGGTENANNGIEQAANLSVLNHSQHLVMHDSRPSSTGHLTPTPVVDKYEGYPPYRAQLGPNHRFWNFADFIIFHTGSVTPTNVPSPDLRLPTTTSGGNPNDAHTANGVNSQSHQHQHQQHQQQQQQQQQQHQHHTQQQSLNDYESTHPVHKRPRISGAWPT